MILDSQMSLGISVLGGLNENNLHKLICLNTWSKLVQRANLHSHESRHSGLVSRSSSISFDFTLHISISYLDTRISIRETALGERKP